MTSHPAPRRAVAEPIGDVLAALAHRVQCLSPNHFDPEAFRIEKSEIVHALRTLAVMTPHSPARPRW
jgi:hypothetical protein